MRRLSPIVKPHNHCPGINLRETLASTIAIHTKRGGCIDFGYLPKQNLCKLTNNEGGSFLRQVSQPRVGGERKWLERGLGTKVPTSSQVMCEG